MTITKISFKTHIFHNPFLVAFNIILLYLFITWVWKQNDRPSVTWAFWFLLSETFQHISFLLPSKLFSKTYCVSTLRVCKASQLVPFTQSCAARGSGCNTWHHSKRIMSKKEEKYFCCFDKRRISENLQTNFALENKPEQE